MYLQIPEKCGYNVPYINPHCLEPVDDPIMTSVLNDMAASALGEEYEKASIFTELGNEEIFEEARQPELIKTPLHRYEFHTFPAGNG
jgi:hypothetical protein